MQSVDEVFLDDVLKKISTNEAIHAGDYLRLTALFLPTLPSSTRSRAFLALSSICDRQRRSTLEDDPGTHNILLLFLPTVEERLADVEEQALLEAVSFVSALFAVDWQSGSAIFIHEGFQDSVMDSLEFFPSSTSLPSAVASILSSACGHKMCRSVLLARCSTWLESTFYYNADVKLKAAVSLALLKLGQGTESKGVEVTGLSENAGDRLSVQKQDELYKSLRDTIVGSGDGVQDVADAVEGLAYLSTKPRIKERIVNDDVLLKTLVSFKTFMRRRSTQVMETGTTPFGLAAIIANVCAYRPRLTEEQAQIDRLKRMAQPGASKSDQASGGLSEDELDSDDLVRIRGKRLVESGAADLLVAIGRSTESTATRMIVGKALLDLVEDKDNRGNILQAGGTKTLMVLIRASQQTASTESSNPLAKANTEFADLLSIQALAKLAITSSPMQVFGPNENASVEAIKPLVCLLSHSSSTLLQRFEAMMALTNLSSVSPDLADRITQTEGLLSKVEFLLLEEHQLVRRAATELICNIVSGSEFAFNRFSGDGSSDSSGSLNQAKSRLHVLVALADVEDMQTRLAASGALASLTGSSIACRLLILLEFEHHRVLSVLKQLIDPSLEEESDNGSVTPNPGLVHRGIVCVRNILVNLSDETLRSKVAMEAVNRGLLGALASIIKSAGQGNVPQAVLQPTAEALKWLMDSGVNVLAQ